MAFYSYIELEGKRYATSQKAWAPTPKKPMTARITIDGAPDVTYGGGTLKTWKGDIMVDITPRGAQWGSVADIRAALALRRGLAFKDHYGTSYTVHFGEWSERSLMPDWENPENTMFFTVQLSGV